MMITPSNSYVFVYDVVNCEDNNLLFGEVGATGPDVDEIEKGDYVYFPKKNSYSQYHINGVYITDAANIVAKFDAGEPIDEQYEFESDPIKEDEYEDIGEIDEFLVIECLYGRCFAFFESGEVFLKNSAKRSETFLCLNKVVLEEDCDLLDLYNQWGDFYMEIPVRDED